MKQAAIGVDIGGTNVKMGLVDVRGRIVSQTTFLTEAGAGRPQLMRRLVAGIRTLSQEARLRGIRVLGAGIGAPGAIDVEKGRVYFFPNLPGWKNVPLKTDLTRALRLPVFLDNDANAMALGEFLFGAGRGCRDMIALTLGTGIGGGIVLGGKLFHGHAFSAAEVGHIVISEDGPVCGCGNRGCVETFIGNGYFVRELQKKMKQGRRSVLSKWTASGKELTPLLAAQAARAGDALAKEAWNTAGERLATALAGLINVLNPERIILGGGVAQNGPILFKPLVRALHKKAFPIAACSVKVLPAALGVDAGLIGAASLVFAARNQ